MPLNSLLVFCSSRLGNLPFYAQQAQEVGETLAQRNVTLIYGAGKVGLMGILADAALAAGGKVIGVIPNFLKHVEIAHESLTELIVVRTMHDRKWRMYELADGIIVLPGGFGTMDELFETLTWAQLGLHTKPIGLLNAGGYFDHLIRFMDNMVEKELLLPDHRQLVLTDDNIEDLLKQMEAFVPPPLPHWLDPSKI